MIEGGHMFARMVQITAKSGQGPNLSLHTRDRTINVLKTTVGIYRYGGPEVRHRPESVRRHQLLEEQRRGREVPCQSAVAATPSGVSTNGTGDPIIRTFNVDASTMHNVGITS